MVRANHEDLLHGEVEASWSRIASAVPGDPTAGAGTMPTNPEARAFRLATAFPDRALEFEWP